MGAMKKKKTRLRITKRWRKQNYTTGTVSKVREFSRHKVKGKGVVVKKTMSAVGSVR